MIKKGEAHTGKIPICFLENLHEEVFGIIPMELPPRRPIFSVRETNNVRLRGISAALPRIEEARRNVRTQGSINPVKKEGGLVRQIVGAPGVFLFSANLGVNVTQPIRRHFSSMRGYKGASSQPVLDALLRRPSSLWVEPKG